MIPWMLEKVVVDLWVSVLSILSDLLGESAYPEADANSEAG